MKKVLATIVAAALSFTLCACSSATESDSQNSTQENHEKQEGGANDQTIEKETVDESGLEALLAQQECYVASTDYIIQDANCKSLHPDLMQAIYVN